MLYLSKLFYSLAASESLGTPELASTLSSADALETASIANAVETAEAEGECPLGIDQASHWIVFSKEPHDLSGLNTIASTNDWSILIICNETKTIVLGQHRVYYLDKLILPVILSELYALLSSPFLHSTRGDTRERQGSTSLGLAIAAKCGGKVFIEFDSAKSPSLDSVSQYWDYTSLFSLIQATDALTSADSLSHTDTLNQTDQGTPRLKLNLDKGYIPTFTHKTHLVNPAYYFWGEDGLNYTYKVNYTMFDLPKLGPFHSALFGLPSDEINRIKHSGLILSSTSGTRNNIAIVHSYPSNLPLIHYSTPWGTPLLPIANGSFAIYTAACTAYIGESSLFAALPPILPPRLNPTNIPNTLASYTLLAQVFRGLIVQPLLWNLNKSIDFIVPKNNNFDSIQKADDEEADEAQGKVETSPSSNDFFPEDYGDIISGRGTLWEVHELLSFLSNHHKSTPKELLNSLLNSNWIDVNTHKIWSYWIKRFPTKPDVPQFTVDSEDAVAVCLTGLVYRLPKAFPKNLNRLKSVLGTTKIELFADLSPEKSSFEDRMYLRNLVVESEEEMVTHLVLRNDLPLWDPAKDSAKYQMWATHRPSYASTYLHQVHALKRCYQRVHQRHLARIRAGKNGFKWLFRLRTDHVFKGEIPPMTSWSTSALMIPKGHDYAGGINDRCAWGSLEMMKVYMMRYNSLAREDVIVNGRIHPETALLKVLTNAGVPIHRVNVSVVHV